MPGYSGLEVCQRLKDSQESARIPVLLTGRQTGTFKPEEGIASAPKVSSSSRSKPVNCSPLYPTARRQSGGPAPNPPSPDALRVPLLPPKKPDESAETTVRR